MPGAYKSALDVHNERQEGERKRKREEEGSGEDETSVPGDGKEKPKEGFKSKSKKTTKRQRVDGAQKEDVKDQQEEPGLDDDEAKRRMKAAKKKQKREMRKVQKAKKKEKLEKKKARRREEGKEQKENKALRDKTSRHDNSDKEEEEKEERVRGGRRGEEEEEESSDDRNEPASADRGKAAETNIDKMGVDGPSQLYEPQSESSVSSSPVPKSPVFDNSTHHSSASSSSSIIPPSTTHDQGTQPRPGLTKEPEIAEPQIAQPRSEPEASEPFPSQEPLKSSLKPQPISTSEPIKNQQQLEEEANPRQTPKLPKIDTAVLQERLQVRLAALRAARKADGPDGGPARTRQELIESRRRRDEIRKAHKKELRAKERVAKDAEEEAKRLRGGSGSPLWQQGAWDEVPEEKLGKKGKNGSESFGFGRVAFEDGVRMDAAGGLKEEGRRKGPSDVKTALAAAERRETKLSGYNEEKRAEIEEKNRWANAQQRVLGEKQKNDAGLLKKTLKRKEKQKGKSEKEWNERTEGVKKGKEAKQKKREQNLQKRRDEKGMKKGKKGKVLGKKPGVKKRPGFEGTFRAGKAPRL